MKKLLSVAVATLAVAAVADYTPQQVGVTAVTTTLKSTVVSVPFTSLAGGNISAKELVKTTNLAEGTCLYVFQDNAYTGWVLAGNQWAPATTASTVDGVSVGIPAENQKLNAGDAIWLVRPSTDTGSKTFYIYGTPVAGLSSKTIPATSDAVVHNLVANPLQSDATISVDAVVAGDEIIIPGDGVPVRYNYKTRKDGTGGTWRCNGQAASLPTIAVGQGFWYIRAANSVAATITFTQASSGN